MEKLSKCLPCHYNLVLTVNSGEIVQLLTGGDYHPQFICH